MWPMKVANQLFYMAISIVLIGGCNPEQLIRDRYMGRAILEPKLQPQPVERDVFGDAIVPKEATKRHLAEKASRHE